MTMDRKGFTLVELMVVLAILGLLAGIGIPQYTKVLERARIGTDIARVAQVQTAVNAFVAECGSLTAVTLVKDAAAPASSFTDLSGTSIVTGQPIAFVANFLDGTLAAVIAQMESTAGQSATTWYLINGVVTIGTATNTNVLK